MNKRVNKKKVDLETEFSHALAGIINHNREINRLKALLHFINVTAMKVEELERRVEDLERR